MPYKPYTPGQRQLSARQLNDQLADLHALNNLDVDGAAHGREGGVHTITLPHRDEGFWAKIDAEGSGSQLGRYAWTEQTLKDDGTFEELDGGRTGTLSPARDYAREYAGKTAVPVGLPVWMVPGTAGPSPTVAGQVNRNPVFVCPDLLQMVRVTDGAISENGDYPGFVRRFDPTADSGNGAYVDAEAIWIRPANTATVESSEYQGRLLKVEHLGRPLYSLGTLSDSTGGGSTGVGGSFSSLLNLSKADCVQIEGFDGTGKCSNIDAFGPLRGQYTPASGMWLTDADEAVTTPIGDTRFGFWMNGDTPALRAIGGDTAVTTIDFEYAGTDGTWAYFRTRSSSVCTDPAGAACVPDEWAVRVRCVSCGIAVRCGGMVMCANLPPCLGGTVGNAAGGMGGGSPGTPPGQTGAGLHIYGGVAGTDGWWLWVPCVEVEGATELDFTQAIFGWEIHLGDTFEVPVVVQVVSELPLHLRFYVNLMGTTFPTCQDVTEFDPETEITTVVGEVGEFVIDAWQDNAASNPSEAEAAGECGPQEVVEDCEHCAGGAPHSWIADLSGYPNPGVGQDSVFGDTTLSAWIADPTVQSSIAAWYQSPAGGCAWTGYQHGVVGVVDNSSVEIDATTVTVVLNFATYSGPKGDSCCGPYVLELTDDGGHSHPELLPTEITLIPYGDCGPVVTDPELVADEFYTGELGDSEDVEPFALQAQTLRHVRPKPQALTAKKPCGGCGKGTGPLRVERNKGGSK